MCSLGGGLISNFNLEPCGPFDHLVCANFAEHPLPSGHQGARYMTGKITIEQQWYQQSEDAKNEAKNLPQGKDREVLIRKARQLHTASQINEWLSSPGLRPPK
jgi:hypothetical protein